MNSRTYKLDEIVSPSGKSIVYHRTIHDITIDGLNYDLRTAGLQIDKNIDESQIKMILAGTLPISYTYNLNKVLKTLNGIEGKGLEGGKGVYGPPAVYNTYEISSQFTGRMYHYGCAIVKSFLKMNHVLILDAAYAQKIYGTLAKPSSQLAFFKAKLTPKEIKLADEAYAKSNLDPNFLTSENANPITNSPSFSKALESGKIKGIVFTGANDGQVLVAYDHDILIPISWCFADDKKQITKWFKFSSTGGRNLRKIAAGNMKYEYDFNDNIFARAKWFSVVMKNENYPEILNALEQKYIYPLMISDGDFLIFKFAKVRDMSLIETLFSVSNMPIINVKSKQTQSNLLLEAVRKNNYTLANYLINNFKVVDINIMDKAKTRLIDVLRTKASISDPEEITFWNKLSKFKHYLDRDDLITLLTGMGLLQENSKILRLYKTIY
jgi:hypothetical protein